MGSLYKQKKRKLKFYNSNIFIFIFNSQLIDAISAVREAVSLENCSDDMSNQSSSYGMYSEDLYDDSNSSSMGSFCQIPEFDLLKINEGKCIIFFYNLFFQDTFPNYYQIIFFSEFLFLFHFKSHQESHTKNELFLYSPFLNK